MRKGRNGKDRNEEYASNKEIWTEGSFMKVRGKRQWWQL